MFASWAIFELLTFLGLCRQ